MVVVTETALFQQQTREHEQVAEGRKRWQKRQRLLEKRGNGADTEAGKAMLPLLLPTVAENLKNLLDEAQARRGAKSEWFEPLQSCDLDMLAAEAVRVSMDAVGARTLFQRWTRNCGQALLDCALMGAIAAKGDKKLNKALASIGRDVEKLKARRKVVAKAADKAGVAKAAWRAEAERLAAQEDQGDFHALLQRIGEVVANAVLLTEVFERYEVYDNARSLVYLGLTETGMVFAAEIEANAQYLQPVFAPMLLPPRKWTGFNTGCYLDKRLSSRVPLVRTYDREQKKLIKDAIAAGNLDEFMRVLDVLGATKMALDADAVAFVVWLWEQGGEGFDGFPTWETLEVPEKPDNWDELTPKQKGKFIQMIKKVDRINRGVACNIVQMKQDIAMMQDLLKHDGFYLPHNTDFRGRVYPVPPFNHQRADYIKGLFLFANGMRLGDKGLYWLMVHAANCADFKTEAGVKLSKLPFKERVRWIKANRLLIESVANDPRGNLDVLRKADAPVGFYVVCRELAQAWRLPNPADFVSRVPVALDGSNSGVQHYSAALRAEEGRFVNLVPGPKPEDLYNEVYLKVLQIAREESRPEIQLPGDIREMIGEWADAARTFRKENPKADKEVRTQEEAFRDIAAARLWLEYEDFGRGTVKRNVMTFGYSSKTGGFKDQLIEDLMDPLEIEQLKALSNIAKAQKTGQEVDPADVRRAKHPFGEDCGLAAAGWLAARVYACVCDTLPATAAGMRYFQTCAGVLAHQAKPTIWFTPMGLPVVHKYCEWETKEVIVSLYDRTVPVWEKTKNDKVTGDGSVLKRYRSEVNVKQKDVILKDKARSAVAPNVIHGQDAAHLMKLTLRGADLGIMDQMHIHDCFGCHAANMAKFFYVIRNTFVEMYEAYDLFGEFDKLVKAALDEEGHDRLRKAEYGAVPTLGGLNLSLVRKSAFSFS